MKYKEIVDIIKNTCLNNFFINEFSYGNISDINTPDDEEPVNYPYAFLNPINISNDGVTSTFNANLIIMTQTSDTLDEELQQQSNCINYLEQIIGKINKNLENPFVEFITPFSVTPFKERFSDNVVGATASIAIQYPSNITDCDTPYAGECDNYQTVCFESGGLSNLNDEYGFWRTGRIEYVALETYNITCNENYVMYTGKTTNTLMAFDTDTPTPEFRVMEVTGGTIGCGEQVRIDPSNGFYLNPDTFTCGGNIYPDDSFPGLSAFDYGKCSCTEYETICISGLTGQFANLNGTYSYYKNAVLEGGAGNNFTVECGGGIAFYTGRTSDTNILTTFAAWDINGDGSQYQWQIGVIDKGTLACGNTITTIPLLPITGIRDLVRCVDNYYPDVSGDSKTTFGACP